MPSRYEDELWRELVAKHGEEPEGEHPPAPPWRPRGPWAAAGGAALVAAAATGGVLAYSAISAPTAAYAVSRNSDGSVKIYLGRASAIKGLNARLKAMNVHAQAVLVAGGCPASQALAAAAPRARGQVHWTGRGQAVLRPARTPARIHFLLVRRSTRGGVSVSDVIGRAGPKAQVPTCVNHVRVFTGPNGAARQAVVVRPLALHAVPGPCGPPPSAAGTTGTTTTTGETTTSGATATTGATSTTGAITSGQTTGTTNAAPPVVVNCCKVVVRAGGGGGTTTAGATTAGATTAGPTTTGATTPTTPTTGTTGPTPTTRTMTWTTTNGTVTTTTAPVPRVAAGPARCQVLRPKAQAVPAPAATLTSPSPSARTSTTRQRSTRH